MFNLCITRIQIRVESCFVRAVIQSVLYVTWRYWTSTHYAAGRATVHSGVHQLPANWDYQLPGEFWPSVCCCC